MYCVKRLHLSGNLDSLKASVRKIHLPTPVDRESIAEYFEIIRYEETVVIVRDFDEHRFRALCESNQCGETAKVYGFNLEELFVELVGRK